MPNHLKKNSHRSARKNSHKDKLIAAFRYAYYEPVFKYFVEQVLDCEFLKLPNPTKTTVEQGVRVSPDDVCAPFKHMMGDWIEALDLGADVLVQVGGPCRLGYYGEMQEKILKDMGYDFTMLNFSHGIEYGYIGWAKEVLRIVNPDIDIPFGVRQLIACGHMLNRIDEVRDIYMANAGFEKEKGAYRRAWNKLLANLMKCSDRRSMDAAFNDCLYTMDGIETDIPANPIRIGIIGELYTAIDEISNLELDEKLLKMGVELHRMLNFSNRYSHYNEEKLRAETSEYIEFDSGPTSTMTIAAAKRYAEEGFDGLIHAKCSGCTPEIDCMPALRRISDDYKIPILYLTYDTETSDTGLMTRLEAFYDMLEMKKTKAVC